jgi:hypothetical protein
MTPSSRPFQLTSSIWISIFKATEAITKFITNCITSKKKVQIEQPHWESTSRGGGELGVDGGSISNCAALRTEWNEQVGGRVLSRKLERVNVSEGDDAYFLHLYPAQECSPDYCTKVKRLNVPTGRKQPSGFFFKSYLIFAFIVGINRWWTKPVSL